jgi:molybdate transport system permease protein
MRAPARNPLWLGLPLLLFLGLPVVALLLSSSPGEFLEAFENPMVSDAISLSVRTTFLSLTIVLVSGTPLAWWLARSKSPWVHTVEALVEIPIILPPAVLGIALIDAYGHQGITGLGLSFTSWAVVIAQVVVAAPFYVQSAAAGFRKINDDQLLVAQTLGATPAQAFFKIAIPSALPALLSGAALCWARALGEFGATLIFAGNYPGKTQTMPLAIYRAFDQNIEVARALAIILTIFAFAMLLLLRLIPAWRRQRSEVRS